MGFLLKLKVTYGAGFAGVLTVCCILVTVSCLGWCVSVDELSAPSVLHVSGERGVTKHKLASLSGLVLTWCNVIKRCES